MPIPRYEREIDRDCRTDDSRACFSMAFGTAALIGLVLGVIWVIAGILHFHPLW